MKKSVTDGPNAQKILQYGFGYAPPLIIEAAIKNRVFDVLDQGAMSLDDLCRVTKASKRGLKAIANALVGMELLAKDSQGCFVNTPESSTFLVSTRSSYIGGRFRHAIEELIPRWLHLANIVKTGHPKISLNKQDSGEPYFISLVTDLFSGNLPAARAAAQKVIVGGKKETMVLDLAAGSGVWGVAMAQESPKVKVTAFDWPGVLPVARQTVSRLKLKNQFSFVEGDIHKTAFGSGFDVVILGHILHSEGEKASVKLLKKVHKSLNDDGRVVIAEWLTNEQKTAPLHSLVFAVNMLVNTDQGDTFSFGEIKQWLEEAGFKKCYLHDVPGPSPLIIAEK